MTTANARRRAEINAKIEEFKRDLAATINRHSMEAFFANVPDYILAEHCFKALALFTQTIMRTEMHYAQQAIEKQTGASGGELVPAIDLSAAPSMSADPIAAATVAANAMRQAEAAAQDPDDVDYSAEFARDVH